MVDSTKTTNGSLSASDRDNLINRIDELENLLAKKKAESRQEQTPKLKVGTDGIPVLVETFADDDINTDNAQLSEITRDNEVINDIINKVDKEISQDLDELIVMLKDSIIDEVKTRLIKELNIKENKAGNNQN